MGDQSDFFGSEILAKRDFFGSRKDTGIFWVMKKNSDFLDNKKCITILPYNASFFLISVLSEGYRVWTLITSNCTYYNRARGALLKKLFSPSSPPHPPFKVALQFLYNYSSLNYQQHRYEYLHATLWGFSS